MSKATLCGLDIGSSKVCCAIAERSRDGSTQLRSIAWAPHHGVRDGHIVDLDVVTDAIQSTVATAESEAGCTVRECLVNVSVPQIQSRTVRGIIPLADHGMEIRTRDIERVRTQAEVTELALDHAILHSVPLDFSIDGELNVDDPLGLVGRQLAMRLRLLTCPHLVLQNLSKALQLAGLDVQQYIYSGLASAQALLTPERSQQTVLILDIGEQLTDAVLLRNGQLLASMTAARGGAALTHAIAQDQHVSLEAAERLKREIRLAREGGAQQVVAQTAQRLLADCQDAVQPLLKEVEHVDLMMMTGRTALLDGFLELAEATFGVPVQLGRVALPTQYSGREPSVTATTAVGLICHMNRHNGDLVPVRQGTSWPQHVLRAARDIYDEYF